MHVSALRWMFVERMKRKYTISCERVCILNPDVRCRHLAKEGALMWQRRRYAHRMLAITVGRKKCLVEGVAGKEKETRVEEVASELLRPSKSIDRLATVSLHLADRYWLVFTHFMPPTRLSELSNMQRSFSASFVSGGGNCSNELE